jgi:mycothiol synthase
MITEQPPQPIEQPRQQLRMVWPINRPPPDIRPHPGYELRTYRPGDEPAWYQVMDLAGFTGWNDEKLAPTLKTILPDGWFMAVQRDSGALAASAMATHHPSECHPCGGELGWGGQSARR